MLIINIGARLFVVVCTLLLLNLFLTAFSYLIMLEKLFPPGFCSCDERNTTHETESFMGCMRNLHNT